MKPCTKCGAVKALHEFSANKSKLDGKDSQCKACVSAYQSARRAENPDKAREPLRNWQSANRQKTREFTRTWDQSHPDMKRKHRAKVRLLLPDHYVVACLRLRVAQCPKALIDLKREQIFLRRLTYELQQELTQQIGETNEP